MNTRALAFNCLKKVEVEKAYSNIVLANVFKENSLSDVDKGFLSNLVYGTIDKKLTLDFYINKFSSVPSRKLDKNVLILLRMSIYQMRYMDSIPASAICNEAVKISKKACSRYSSFINAVLRAASKSEIIKAPILYNKKDFHSYTRFLSVKYSFPEWMVDKWLEEYGKDACEQILNSYQNISSSMTIRVNTLKATKQALKKQLETDFQIFESDFYKYALIIENPKGIFDTSAYREGLFYVQDLGSMIIPSIAYDEIAQSSKVLDLCAAPGGKTTQIAEYMKNTGEILACDIHENKLSLINENATRLGVTNIKAIQNDASIFNSELVNAFDFILLDAPCSGTGVLKNKPDIKWNRTIEDINDLSELQYKILTNAFEYLKPNGTLVYSTCSIEKQENENVINSFIEGHKNIELVDFIINDLQSKNGMFTILPGEFKSDGFFMAKLRKI